MGNKVIDFIVLIFSVVRTMCEFPTQCSEDGVVEERIKKKKERKKEERKKEERRKKERKRRKKKERKKEDGCYTRPHLRRLLAPQNHLRR